MIVSFIVAVMFLLLNRHVGSGSLLYGKPVYALALFAVVAVSMVAIFRTWDRISGEEIAH